MASKAPPPPPPHLTANYQNLLSSAKQPQRQLNASTTQESPVQGLNNQIFLPGTQFPANSSYNNFMQQQGQGKKKKNKNQARFQPYERQPVNKTPFHSMPSFLQSPPVGRTISKDQEVLNLLKQFPRSLSTIEIGKNFYHLSKQRLQETLEQLCAQGLVLKQPGFGLEAWRINPNPPSPSLSIPSNPALQLQMTNSSIVQSPNPLGVGSSAQFAQNTPLTKKQRKQLNKMKAQSVSNLTVTLDNSGIDSRSIIDNNTSPLTKKQRKQLNKLKSQSTFSIMSATTNDNFSSPSVTLLTKKQKKQLNSSIVMTPPPKTAFTLSANIFNSLNKNPVSALNELCQKNGQTVSFDLVAENAYSQKNKFTVAANVSGKMYDAVTASNMKDARREAADIALKVILKECVQAEARYPTTNVLSSNATHFDKMAASSHRTFIEKSNMVQEKFAGRKVIACMLMSRGESDGVVVALGAGNRCITGQRLSMEGKVVNDSHAEIICRRAFISFLYEELEKHMTGKESIFQGGGGGGEKFKIKEGVSFHLYISTAPCGDGALFTPRLDEKVSPDFPKKHSPVFSSKVHGITRSKIENGEGTIPIEKEEAEQTFDGILRGERLRTMSCSDKICRWNVVGMQGALLSHLMDPVYLDSLTLGYLYDHGHLSRALCCRLDKDSTGDFEAKLAKPFRLNHPWIGRVTQYEAGRETEKTNNISINWSFYDVAPEVTDGRTGAQLSRTGGIPTPSRLCKFEMLNRFRSLISKTNKCKHLSEQQSYRELKDSALEFQNTKKSMMEALKDMNYGPWVKKPSEQDMF